MSAVSKIVYFDVSNNIINEYNNTYNRAIVTLVIMMSIELVLMLKMQTLK